jgi:hypothetical protein
MIWIGFKGGTGTSSRTLFVPMFAMKLKPVTDEPAMMQ